MDLCTWGVMKERTWSDFDAGARIVAGVVVVVVVGIVLVGIVVGVIVLVGVVVIVVGTPASMLRALAAICARRSSACLLRRSKISLRAI